MTTTPPTGIDRTHLESIAEPIITLSTGICQTHPESVAEPTITPPAADLITMKAEVDARNTESSETQPSVPPELIRSNACEYTHRDDAQKRQHYEDIPPDDRPSIGIDHSCLESADELITTPLAADLIAAKAEVTEHDPGPPEPRPSTPLEPLYSDAYEPIEP
ncbi:hypothetical protein EV182_008611, partial [Spiromyces aspiralis]